MKAIHKRYIKTIGVTWGISLLLFLLAYMIVLGPLGRSRVDTYGLLLQQKDAYEESCRVSKEEVRETLKKEVQELTDRVGDFVVPIKDSADLTFNISRIAEKYKIESFNIKNQSNAGILGLFENKYACENHIEISFSSDFAQFARLLNAIERHRPVLFVENFRITSPVLDGEKPQISMNLVYLARKLETDEK